MIALCFLMFAEFTFQDFASTQGLNLVGDASKSNRVLRLTRAEKDKAGAAWFAQKQHVANGFDTTFRFQLTDQGGLGDGADGLALVLQSGHADAIAGHGSAGGFALGEHRERRGIPNSVAVFFDTYKNDDAKDPSNNYVAICTNGKLSDMRWPPARLAMVKKLKVDLKDRNVHEARITYQPPVLTVYLDGARIVASPVELATVMDVTGSAYIGFTASTGNGWENHDILNWSFQSLSTDVSSDLWQSSSTITYMDAACLEGRNLCTPERSIVEEKGEGRYHIVLPAHLEWGASIPNPSGKPVSITNAHGTVCRDFEARGADGCSGPGALTSRNRNGRTWFSVKDSGKGFKDNQGYFEFDVVVP